jgi:hypothetical protein
MTKYEHIRAINILAEDLAWQSSIAIKNETYIPHFDAAAEATAVAIAEYLNARQDQRDAELEAMTERREDEVDKWHRRMQEESRERSGMFHYDEEMPLEQAFEG